MTAKHATDMARPRGEPETAPDESVLQVFPWGTSRDVDGTLVVGGCRVDDVALEYGTPTYLVDEWALRRQARRFVSGLASRRPGSAVAFASKAFPASAVTRLLHDEGCWVDVAGRGELLLALHGGVEPSRILVHGNAKTDDELRLAVDAKVGLIVVDGFDELDALERLAGRRQAVLVRVRPDVDPQTAKAISTGQRGSKFGVGLAELESLVQRVRRSTSLELSGLHVHLGSQMTHLAPFREAVAVLGGCGVFGVYDVGGGLAVRYHRDDQAPPVEDWLDTVTDAAAQFLPSDAQLMVEPGRSLVAQSTVSLYRVVAVKPGERAIVAVDGGIADNFEASTYVGVRFEAAVANRPGGTVRCDVVGRQCESGDVLALDVLLDDPRPGDLIVVPMTGAYTHTMANTYNGARRAPVAFADAGRARAVVRRDTDDDLLARELPWP